MPYHLGIVRYGQWRFLPPDDTYKTVRRLTHFAPRHGRSPESGEMDLSDFEGCLVLVEGDDDGTWIYSAQLVDQCDSIMSNEVLHLLKAHS